MQRGTPGSLSVEVIVGRLTRTACTQQPAQTAGSNLRCSVAGTQLREGPTSGCSAKEGMPISHSRLAVVAQWKARFTHRSGSRAGALPCAERVACLRLCSLSASSCVLQSSLSSAHPSAVSARQAGS